MNYDKNNLYARLRGKKNFGGKGRIDCTCWQIFNKRIINRCLQAGMAINRWQILADARAADAPLLLPSLVALYYRGRGSGAPQNRGRRFRGFFLVAAPAALYAGSRFSSARGPAMHKSNWNRCENRATMFDAGSPPSLSFFLSFPKSPTIYICIRRIEIPGRGIFGVRDHNAPLWQMVRPPRNEVSTRPCATPFRTLQKRRRRRSSSRDPFTRGEKSFEYKGTINATVPFSFPFWTFLVSLPCRGNPTIRNKREKEEGYEYNPSA